MLSTQTIERYVPASGWCSHVSEQEKLLPDGLGNVVATAPAGSEFVLDIMGGGDGGFLDSTSVYRFSIPQGFDERYLSLEEYGRDGRLLRRQPVPALYSATPDTSRVKLRYLADDHREVAFPPLHVLRTPASRVEDFYQSLDVRSNQELSIEIRTFSSDPGNERSALVTFEFLDEGGAVVAPPNAPINPRLGPYLYLESSSGLESVTRYKINVPRNARVLEVRGHKWRRDVSTFIVRSDFALSSSRPMGGAGVRADLDAFLRPIPVDARVVVLYTTAPTMSHPTLLLRPNRLAREYAAAGAYVIFFPFSRVSESERRASGRIRQYCRSDLSEVLAVLASRSGRNNVFICSSFPDMHAVAAVDLLKLSGWSVMYEVRDDMEEFNRVGYSKWFRTQLERRICNRADAVVSVSPRLDAKMRVLLGGGNGKTVVIPNGVSSSLADQSKELRGDGYPSERNGSRTVGYIGHLTPSWFDWSLLIYAARAMPDVVFEVVGHGAPATLEFPSNLILLGPQSHDEFLSTCRRWKVGLIPFISSTLSHAVDPNKIYEYFAVGLRVVSAPMGSVDSYPSTRVYRNRDEFVAQIREQLREPMTQSELAELDKFVASSTWTVRATQMLGVMDQMAEDKQ